MAAKGSLPKPSDAALRELIDVAYYAEVRCRFRCDARQRDLLRRESKQVVLNCSRQSGKSTLAALKMVHAARWRAKSTIVVTAPVQQQTRELLRKAREFARIAGVLHRNKGSKYCVEFANGSRIVGVTADEDTIRGFSSVTLLVVDEASRVREEVFEAAEPMLAVSGGGLWILSTPNGRGGYFYKAWHAAAGWAKLRMTAMECAGRISERFLHKQREKLGARRFAQEFECEFVELDRGVFDAESVSKAFRKGVTAIKELEL
jgi:phage FluMu gp28-like protein